MECLVLRVCVFLDTGRVFVPGMAAKMFVIAGPVLVYGLAAGVIYGVLLVLFGAGG